MKVVIIDNYDSFTFNLHHYLEPWVGVVDVVRNDEFQMKDIEEYDGIILSPGPGLPEESGQLMELIETYYDSKPILGVCLGHQALGLFFGAALGNLPEVLHGQPSECKVVEEDMLFERVESPFLVGHYHSWVVSDIEFPHEELTVTARNYKGYIMAMHHNKYPIHSVQFHPESILTPQGKMMILNWVLSLKRTFVPS